MAACVLFLVPTTMPDLLEYHVSKALCNMTSKETACSGYAPRSHDCPGHSRAGTNLGKVPPPVGVRYSLFPDQRHGCNRLPKKKRAVLLVCIRLSLRDFFEYIISVLLQHICLCDGNAPISRRPTQSKCLRL